MPLTDKDTLMDGNCHIEPAQKNATVEERQTMDTVVLTVWGMGCPNCAARVRNSLLSLYGVIEAYVDHVFGMAQVVFNPELATVEALLLAVARAGNDGRHEYGAQLLR